MKCTFLDFISLDELYRTPLLVFDSKIVLRICILDLRCAVIAPAYDDLNRLCDIFNVLLHATITLPVELIKLQLLIFALLLKRFMTPVEPPHPISFMFVRLTFFTYLKVNPVNPLQFMMPSVSEVIENISVFITLICRVEMWWIPACKLSLVWFLRC